MSGMFNMGATQNLKNASEGKYLSPGIHNATFKGVKEVQGVGKHGENYIAMDILFDIEGFGEFSHRKFEPKSAERVETTWGQNPSQMEQFTVFCRHLFDALNPKIGEGIDNGSISISASSFSEFVALVKKYTDKQIGKALPQIKLLPERGYSQIPAFPAGVDKKTGNLYLTTRFFGENLTLTAKELDSIEKAKNATPTNMASASKSDLMDEFTSKAKSDFSVDDDDLPF